MLLNEDLSNATPEVQLTTRLIGKYLTFHFLYSINTPRIIYNTIKFIDSVPIFIQQTFTFPEVTLC